MWVVQQNNGKFKFTERYKDRLTGKTKYVSTTLTKDSPQAHNTAKQILGEKIHKKQTSSSDIGFSKLAHKWVEVMKQSELTLATKSIYESQVNVLVRKLGDTKIKKLTAPFINNILLGYLNEGQAYNTLLMRLNVIKLILIFGYDYGFFDKRFPVEDLKVPKINMPKKTALTDKYLEPDEAEKVFAALEDRNLMQYVYLFKIQMYTGMRFNEATALSLPQIDFDDRKILVNRQYIYPKRDYDLPKGGKIRTTAYNLQLAKLFDEILERRKGLIKLHGETDLLIFKPNLTPYTLTSANDYLKTIDFPKKITTHIFRHTYITRMVENYVPAKLIAKQVGHEDTTMIDQIYGHFSQKMKDDLSNKINEIEF